MSDLYCAAAVELVPSLVDGALPADQRLALEQHIVVCGGCTAVLEQMRTTVALLGALPGPTLGPAARRRLDGLAGPILAARRGPAVS